ncbi:hypothetical protein J3R30DRAFT_3680178 [Lentinula aciculospora]|uniref:Uncharacterized protein n=1 Tax=Lentinula aciculospora TaxID=153920 RepID=A0A9W9AM11_9AGAR|nr:hypothetical protein J3R30DRAFT_3680178 [Lentinula aciculospora]
MQITISFVLLAVAHSALALPFKNIEVGSTTTASNAQTISSVPAPMIFAKVAWDVEKREVIGAAPIFAKDQGEVETSVDAATAASTTTPTSIIFAEDAWEAERQDLSPRATTTALAIPSSIIFAKEAWEFRKRDSAISAIFAKDQWETEPSSVIATSTSLPAGLIFAKDAWEMTD